MPLFGFRKDKKHEQGHVQAKAESAKKAAAPLGRRAVTDRDKALRTFKSDKPEKVSARVVTKDAGAAKSGPVVPKGGFSGAAGAILRPHITEKSGISSQTGAYTFDIAADANKPRVAAAVEAIYKVTPIKVTLMNGPSKRVFVRGKRGVVPGVRKAIVTVKKGEKIDFV